MRKVESTCLFRIEAGVPTTSSNHWLHCAYSTTSMIAAKFFNSSGT